jgi:hypothetical protein
MPKKPKAKLNIEEVPEANDEEQDVSHETKKLEHSEHDEMIEKLMK